MASLLKPGTTRNDFTKSLNRFNKKTSVVIVGKYAEPAQPTLDRWRDWLEAAVGEQAVEWEWSFDLSPPDQYGYCKVAGVRIYFNDPKFASLCALTFSENQSD